MGKGKYSDLLRDPRWQKKRLKVMQRDRFCCCLCGDEESMLAVHHMWYDKGKEPWDYPMRAFVTLCERCHSEERDERPAAESLLLYFVRKCGLFAGDVDSLAWEFESLSKKLAQRDGWVTATLTMAFDESEVGQKIEIGRNPTCTS